MIDICVEIAINPVGAKRPRARVIQAAPGRKARVQVYVPAVTKAFQRALGLAVKAHVAEHIDEDVRVDVLAALGRPKRLMRAKDPDGLLWAGVKPDRDNIDKNVLDALRVIWRDDALVCLGTLLKCYAPKGAAPCLVLRIRSASLFDPNQVADALGLRPSACDDLTPEAA